MPIPADSALTDSTAEFIRVPASASAMTKAKDDMLTMIAIAALACILQDVVHEFLGHGVAAWLSGARQLTVSTVALQSDIETRWISAAGTLVNLFFALVFWILLRRPQRYTPATRYFLVLALAGNLFTGTGYFFFSGVSNIGDWAAVINGRQPYWLWRLGLFVLGVTTYYLSMLLVAAHLAPFNRQGENWLRLRSLCWTPYFADGTLAGLAGLFNPLGLYYVLISSLASTLGANAGLLSLPGMMLRLRRGVEEPVATISRSTAWIAVGAIASLLFIFVLGRGLTWSR